MSGLAEPDVLVVQSVNVEHTCSVSKHYFTYPEVRKEIPQEEQTTIATLMDFNISASAIAIYLRDKGLSNITQKDVANWRAKLRHSGSSEETNGVCVCVSVSYLQEA